MSIFLLILVLIVRLCQYVLTIHQDKFEQIVGTYSLDLNNFHTKDPYAHMAETCPSLAPDYKKPADC